MPARPETTATSTAAGRGKTPGRRTEGLVGSTVRRPEIIVGIVIPAAVVGAGVVAVIRGAGIAAIGAGTIIPVAVAVVGISQVIAGWIECAQVAQGRTGDLGIDQDHAPSIIRVVEIGIITGIPHEITVPPEIRIEISEAHAETGIPESITIRGECGTIICACSDRGIVSIVIVVVVEGRPARLVHRLHADILVAGSGAVIFILVAGGGSRNLMVSRRIIYVIGCLSYRIRRRTTAHQQDGCSGKKGINGSHGESF